MNVQLTAGQARYLRLRGQGLLPLQPSGPDAPVAVVRQSCGLQAQDMFAATLGVRVRSVGRTIEDVERARFHERSVVWTWAMRGTLHLLPADDLDWLLLVLGPSLVAASARRRAELGLDEDAYARGLRVVRDWLAAHGPSTREELGSALTAAGLPAGYSVERHLMYRAALEGIVCMGPDHGAKPTFVLFEDWLGRSRSPAPGAGSTAMDAALAQLASRYLAAYAPAAPADLAAWSGLPMSLVSVGWNTLTRDLVEVAVEGRLAWIPAARLAELDAPPPVSPDVRLLPAFDTYLLGHRDRQLVLDPAYSGHLNAGGGMIKAAVLVDGQVAGTWRSNRKGRRVNITVDQFAPFSGQVEDAIAVETADIERFLNASVP